MYNHRCKHVSRILFERIYPRFSAHYFLKITCSGNLFSIQIWSYPYIKRIAISFLNQTMKKFCIKIFPNFRKIFFLYFSSCHNRLYPEQKSVHLWIRNFKIVIYNGNEPLTKTTDYTIADKVITIVKEDISVGDSLFITSYSYTGTSGEYFEVSESANALAFEIIQRKPIFDTNMNIKSWRVRHFGKATLDPSTEETGESERGEQPIT